MTECRLRSTAVVTLMLVAVLAGCGRSVSPGVHHPVVAADEQDLLGPWTDTGTGRELPDGSNNSGGILVVGTSAGSTTCSSDGTVFLQLAWPIGEQVNLFSSDLAPGSAPQFVRDTTGSAMETIGTSDLDTQLPSTARPTGFQRAGNTISIEERKRQAYVTRADGRTERWARLVEGVGCA